MADSRAPRVLAVVVAYGRGLADVEAWPLLVRLLNAGPSNPSGLQHVLIYDNSAQPLARPSEPIPGSSYVHDASNGGTAAAYTAAALLAAELDIDWLLLLDHDTSLPEGFVGAAIAALNLSSTLSPPAALLPWVCHQQTVVSPARITCTGTILPLRKGEPLAPGARVTAIASGSLLRATTMRTLLPIPADLWLDYVDHWIFSELHARHAPILFLDQVLQHDLSIASPTSLSPGRLSSVLNGEARFIGSMGWVARVVYPVRVTVRMLRLIRVSPRLALHTLIWGMRRFVLSKP